jgi:serine/threonine protein kinase
MMQRDARLVGGVYRISEVITSGGMLTICTAHNRNTSSMVGLLIIEFSPDLNPLTVQQLLQPLERRQAIRSPQVISVYDWGIDGNRAYIATDRPHGITLRYVLDTENIDLPRVLDFSRQVAQGLRVLHRQGISGLDLRPQLITVDTESMKDQVQLDDVGLRSLLNNLGYVSSQRFDDIGYLDPRYAPPEYIQGGQIGPWSDIYQTGLLIFELITGRLPFVGRNAAETGVLQSNSPIPRMTQFKHDAPASLQTVVDRALAKNPDERFASADELLAALDEIQLPPRLTPGMVIPWEGKPTSAGHGSTTGEMASLDDAMRAAPIEGLPTVIPSSMSADSNAFAFLSFEVDGMEKQRFAVTQKSVVVGRSDPKRNTHPDIDLTPLDQNMTVSRQHARIRYEETLFYIEDLKSRNSTRLGTLKLEPFKAELVNHGDTLRFGSVQLIFRLPGLPPPPTLKILREE